ncbi:hypothetical protein [Actinacidiphila rubida]|uniref:Uncharacterized protein n=1 Tax=Actinacidiphila rubida TaxID=310780 RepID=A0A1H8S4C4_9ACTN|nr:hypothetical protein [Actinacidiphila rubida]SEO73849.1 hypothetical protein SAMN05216267_103957 [Actinacidiphila rubida]
MPDPDSNRPGDGCPLDPNALFPLADYAPAAGTTADDRKRSSRKFVFSRALRTKGFKAAGETTERLHTFLLNEPEYTLLANHHEGDSSFAVLFDSSATWDIPGTANLVAVHLVRNQMWRTFDFDTAHLPMVALAQQWLVARGCPPEAIVLPPERATQPADQETTILETHLRTSPDRYTLVDHYTDDGGPFESWALLRDTHPESAGTPVRVFIEAADMNAGTYTLREGGFADEDGAREWLDGRPGPLPPALRTSRPGAASRPAVPPPSGASGPRR